MDNVEQLLGKAESTLDSVGLAGSGEARAFKGIGYAFVALVYVLNRKRLG